MNLIWNSSNKASVVAAMPLSLVSWHVHFSLSLLRPKISEHLSFFGGCMYRLKNYVAFNLIKMNEARLIILKCVEH